MKKRFAQETRDRIAPLSARVLKERRKKLKLSVEEFAGRSNIEPARIALLEDGRHAPYINELEGLAFALGVPLLHLLNEIIPPRDSSAPGGTP